MGVRENKNFWNKRIQKQGSSRDTVVRVIVCRDSESNVIGE